MFIAHYGETQFDTAMKAVEESVSNTLNEVELSISSFRELHECMVHVHDMSVREAVWHTYNHDGTDSYYGA